MKKKQNGLTLVELMVTMAVALVLLLVGVPQFQSMLAGNRAAVDANKLVVAMQLARSEAVKRNLPVSVCGKNSGANNCTLGDWTEGIVVFVDTAGGVIGNVDVATDIVRILDAPDGNPIIADDGDFLRFDIDGSLERPAAPFRFTVHQEGCVGRNQRTITVSATGQVDILAGSCP